MADKDRFDVGKKRPAVFHVTYHFRRNMIVIRKPRAEECVEQDGVRSGADQESFVPKVSDFNCIGLWVCAQPGGREQQSD